jgi:hypothetical protein
MYVSGYILGDISRPLCDFTQKHPVTLLPGVNVMNAIFSDFCQFSANEWRFSSEQMTSAIFMSWWL